MKIQGGDDLRARLKEVRLTFKVYGKKWNKATAEHMRAHIPRASGDTANSIRPKSATQRKATVVGSYVTNFIDAGSKAHEIKARRKPYLVFQVDGQTIFAKKVHKQRVAARPFKRAAALEGLRRHPMRDTMIELWNRAA